MAGVPGASARHRRGRPHRKPWEAILQDWVRAVQLGLGPADVMRRGEVKADFAPGAAIVAARHGGALQSRQVPEGGNVRQVVQA